jgi:hypothetical protein
LASSAEDTELCGNKRHRSTPEKMTSMIVDSLGHSGISTRFDDSRTSIQKQLDYGIGHTFVFVCLG